MVLLEHAAEGEEKVKLNLGSPDAVLNYGVDSSRRRVGMESGESGPERGCFCGSCAGGG